MLRPDPRGFTLIELLIVVAIIAILAAIAVPNFLEAQTRAKVSRSLADMRSIATGNEQMEAAMDSYLQFMGDHGGEDGEPEAVAHLVCLKRENPLPPTNLTDSRPRSFSFMTSPVAYITSIPFDTFERTLTSPFNTLDYWDNFLCSVYFDTTVTRGGFLLVSVGPDGFQGWGRRVRRTVIPTTC